MSESFPIWEHLCACMKDKELEEIFCKFWQVMAPFFWNVSHPPPQRAGLN